MIVTNQVLSAELFKVTGWKTLYWWNHTEKGWQLANKSHKNLKLSVPAYNFDFLFEKMRLVFQTQDDDQQLQIFKMLLSVPNPTDDLAKLAIDLANAGLFK